MVFILIIDVHAWMKGFIPTDPPDLVVIRRYGSTSVGWLLWWDGISRGVSHKFFQNTTGQSSSCWITPAQLQNTKPNIHTWTFNGACQELNKWNNFSTCLEGTSKPVGIRCSFHMPWPNQAAMRLYLFCLSCHIIAVLRLQRAEEALN